MACGRLGQGIGVGQDTNGGHPTYDFSRLDMPGAERKRASISICVEAPISAVRRGGGKRARRDRGGAALLPRGGRPARVVVARRGGGQRLVRRLWAGGRQRCGWIRGTRLLL